VAAGQTQAATALLILLALFHVILGERLWNPARNLVFDRYQRWLPRQVSRFPVVIVDIDERSLASFGRWPWPRTRLAQLVESTHRLGALSVGLDIIMPEADSLSLNHLATTRTDLSPTLREVLEQLPSNDAVLAKALGKTPSVIARAAITGGGTVASTPSPQTPVIVVGSSPIPYLISFSEELANIPELEAAASGRGYANDTRDSDGVVRAMPLVLAVNGAPAPSLAVEILRVATGEKHYSLRSDQNGVIGVQIADRFIATDRDGRMRLRFSPALAARRISAAAILNGEVKAGALADQVAIVGATAVGVSDVAATPAAARMDGVDIQAQLIENILEGNRLRRPPWARWSELGALVLFALLLIVVLPRLRPAQGLAVFCAGTVLLGFVSLSLFHQRSELYDPTFPAAVNALIVLLLLTVGFTESERHRRELDAALQAEKVERVRVAAELQAASDIQMGMLPDPRAIEGLPENLDFFAMLEPAQEVGGDLYDAFMLDERRLCFMIGDVSGKGIPASLFMALTKTLAKSLARREHTSLERALRAVNEEISRENRAAMFVTAIIGVVDARNGEVELCNAGHNAPILLRPGEPPKELDGAGGPPLCVDEEFPYSTQRVKLEGGDILLFITDGVNEAEDNRQAQYGTSRMLECFTGASPADAAGVCERLYADVKRFTAGAAPSDDLAIVAVRFIERGKE
jgi:CHASE2 domain-containing sensor protein/serine phosphatase RsbU (regulator of sigma subunit)